MCFLELSKFCFFNFIIFGPFAEDLRNSTNFKGSNISSFNLKVFQVWKNTDIIDKSLAN